MTGPSTRSDAGLFLLDRDIPADYRQEWTQYVAEEPGTVRRGTRAALMFRIGGEWMALPIGVLQAVAPPASIHSIPHQRNRIVRGITNVRGDLVLCISLPAILAGENGAGAPAAIAGANSSADAEADARRRMLVLAAPGGALVMPVDEVYGVHRYLPDDLQAIPATLAHSAARYTEGLLPWRDRTVAQLDTEAIFIAVERALA